MDDGQSSYSQEDLCYSTAVMTSLHVGESEFPKRLFKDLKSLLCSWTAMTNRPPLSQEKCQSSGCERPRWSDSNREVSHVVGSHKNLGTVWRFHALPASVWGSLRVLRRPPTPKRVVCFSCCLSSDSWDRSRSRRTNKQTYGVTVSRHDEGVTTWS